MVVYFTCRKPTPFCLHEPDTSNMITHTCDFSLYLTKASRGDNIERPTLRAGQLERAAKDGLLPIDILDQLKAGKEYVGFISDCKGGVQREVIRIKMNREAKDSYRIDFPKGWPAWLRTPTSGKGNGVTVYLMRLTALNLDASNGWRDLNPASDEYYELPAVGEGVFVACADGRVCCAIHTKKNVFVSRMLGQSKITEVTHWHPAVIHPAASGL